MSRKMSLALLAGASFLVAAPHQAAGDRRRSRAGEPTVHLRQTSRAPPSADARRRSNMGGGFIEFLFGDGPGQGQRALPATADVSAAAGPTTRVMLPPMDPQQQMQQQQEEAADPAQRPFDPKYEKQVVDYHGKEGPGTIVIDTPNKFLFLVQGDGKALRYGIGVGRPGFTWAGVKTISAKKEWPDWTPPPEMLVRRPDLPRHMEGGPENPLGARAMYLGSSLYRIHGSNEPWTIGTNVSSGCIRMRNEDVIDLYGRVKVGTKVDRDLSVLDRSNQKTAARSERPFCIGVATSDQASSLSPPPSSSKPSESWSISSSSSFDAWSNKPAREPNCRRRGRWTSRCR